MTATGPNTQSSLFEDSFSTLQDPRRLIKGNIMYPINEILFLTISAVVSGSMAWTSIETFGEMKLDWLRKFYPYNNGIPSHDAISDLFSALSPSAFGSCFMKWVNSISQISEGEIVAIDGKTIRGAASSGNKKYPLHIVSAYAAHNRLCLGQEAVGEKSNEITAIPRLLDLLSLKGCIVTIDAMGCQKEIAQKIVDKGADYVLMVKDNQAELKEQVEKMFRLGNGVTSDSNVDAGHGRVETRVCNTTQDLTFFDTKEQWPHIKSVVQIKSERMFKKTGETSTETRYYISTLPANAKHLNDSIRTHWAIENNLHWSLDVIFGEDGQLKRNGYSAQNFNIISKIALGLLEKECTVKNTKPNKRLMAALNDNYREMVLNC